MSEVKAMFRIAGFAQRSTGIIRYLIMIWSQLCMDTRSIHYLNTVPVICMCLLRCDISTNRPKEQKEDLYKLMAERIGFVYDSDNKRVLISRVLGRDIDRNLINIEEKIGVAHILILSISVISPSILTGTSESRFLFICFSRASHI